METGGGGVVDRVLGACLSAPRCRGSFAVTGVMHTGRHSGWAGPIGPHYWHLNSSRCTAMFNPRTDSLRDEGPLFGEPRRRVQAECERLASTIDTLDAELDRIARQRRELAQQLRGHRRRLWPRLAKRARLPGPDGSVQLPPVPRGAVFVRGRRLRWPVWFCSPGWARCLSLRSMLCSIDLASRWRVRTR